METIRIHHADTDDEAKARHEQIVKRLQELGKVQVQAMMATGGLPTVWNPIIYEWLRDK